MHLVATALTAALTAAAHAAPADEVKPLADAFDQAQIAKNIAVMDASLADDVVFIKGSGRVTDKAEFLKGFGAADFKLNPFELKNRRFVELAPDVVSATADVSLTGMDGKESFTENIRFSDIWAKRGDTWKVVYIQVSPLKAAP